MQFDLPASTQILARTPGIIRDLLQELPESWIFNNEGLHTWSPFDILGHLIHGERTDWIPRACIILDHGVAKTFDPFDRFAQFQESGEKTLEGLLDTFASLRQANLETLAAMRLSLADLDRQGMHPEIGLVTMRQLLATWVVHDLSHIAQIAGVMASHYKQTIGPWIAYFPHLEK